MLPRSGASEHKVGPGRRELGAPAHRAGADPAARRDVVEPRPDERVARVAPLGHRREIEALGGRRREVLGGVHREVGPALEHRLLHLLREHARAADRVEVGVLVAVAGRRDEHQFCVLAQQLGDALRLPPRQRARARRDSEHG
jgi:hypothetical protein